jgi:AcrR family transcriptional regulator
VFAAEGFQRASIDAIAERVGIAKGTVYLHFASKEDLLLALLRHLSENLSQDCARQAEAVPDAQGRLEGILKVLVDWRFSNGPLVRIVSAEVPHFIGSWRESGASEPLRHLIAGVVEQGKAEGFVDSGVDSAMASRALLLLVFMTDDHTGKQSKRHVIEQVQRLYFRGICKEVR